MEMPPVLKSTLSTYTCNCSIKGTNTSRQWDIAHRMADQQQVFIGHGTYRHLTHSAKGAQRTTYGTQSTTQRQQAHPGRVLIYNMQPQVHQAWRHSPYALHPF